MLVNHPSEDMLTSLFVGIDTLVKAIIDGKIVYGRIESVQTWFGTEYFCVDGIWIDEDCILDSYS